MLPPSLGSEGRSSFTFLLYFTHGVRGGGVCGGNKPQFTSMRPKFIICVSNGMKEDEDVEREQEFRDEFKGPH